VDSEAAIDTCRTLDEVSVVALKQEERLRNEAVSATAVGRVQLENLNAAAIKSVSDIVPNVYIPDYGSRITSTIYVRGIGARMDQPAVGLNVDNVPILNKNAFDFDLADIASVEMLRGPQSTLYGRNTIAGLINISTLSPLRYQGWRITASGGSGNDWKASAGWYHKLNDNFATAIIGSFSYLGGFFRNQYNGKLLDKELGGGLRWKTDWRITRDLHLQNVASASILRQGGYPYESVASGEINYNDTCFYRRFLFNDGLTLRLKKDTYTMTSITSVQYLDDNMTLDQDFLPLPYFTLTQRQRETAVTEDLMFRGSAADDRYTWLAGAFLFYKNIDMNAPVTFKDTGIKSLIEDHRNSANPYYPIDWDSREFRLNSDFSMPTFGTALYHESRYKLSRWQFTLGLRLDFEQSALRYRSYCNTGYQLYRKEENGDLTPYRHIGLNIDDRDRLKRRYFNWLPKLSVLYNIDEAGDNNLFAVVSKGYKAGGFNTQMFSDVLQQRLMGMMGIGAKYDVDDVVGYKPEYSWNYEIGGHFSIPVARLLLDASIFFIDCRDQQLTMFPDGTTTGRIMTNAGRTRSCGGEISADWTPIDALSVKAGYGYTNAKFLEFDNGIADYAGKYLPYVPQNTLNTSVAYTFTFRNRPVKSLALEANLRGTGKIFWNEQNSLYQDFYLLPGASVILSGEKWSLQIWGKNLSDTRYRTFYFLSMGNEFLQRGRPIQLGATIRVSI
jgi:outer membrane receptor protein involved in Fe transport